MKGIKFQLSKKSMHLRVTAMLPTVFLFLFINIATATAIAAQQRGVTVINDASGNTIELYRESYALLIGVSDYTAGWPKLESIPNEIKAVREVLEQQGFKVVLHLNPDHDALEKAFEDFIDDYGYDPQNRLLFFFAGHGETRQNGRSGYLVPTDAPLPAKDEKGFLQKALPMSQIKAWARQIEAKHALFLFDSCFSGTVFKQRALSEVPPHISTLTAEPVRQFITAGSAGETVPANSVFTPVFIDGLKHRLADLDRDGYVTGTELGVYLQGKVPQHVRQTPQFGKINDYELSRGDFVFLLDDKKHEKSIITIKSPQKPQQMPQTPELRGTRNAFLPELAYIPPGTFDMGEQEGVSVILRGFDMGRDAASSINNFNDFMKQYYGVPEKRIQINQPFYLSKTEITYEQYDYYVEMQQREGQSIANPDTATGGRGKQPVVNVNWFEAVAYADWLGQQTNNHCRLPTEAEWEYAARAGTTTAYPWGDEIGHNNANCKGCGSQWDGKQAAPVGSFAANRFGLHDMVGNVTEWTCSAWRDRFDGSEQRCNDDVTDGQYRVLRSGSWNVDRVLLRASYRYLNGPGGRNDDVGFRVLCSSPIE